MIFDKEELSREIKFKTTRSSGAGGQNVNKVETKVLLLWDIEQSALFNDAQKIILNSLLQNRIQAEGLLQIEASETRSQLANKELALEKLVALIETALKPRKKRIATKIPRSKVLERLDAKRKNSEKKSTRRWKMD